ncbi:BTB/POZ domain-containing protein At5g47800-like [Vicia villosa]|uniref:BTB/POZ domain-containing protein At5g47800-like n=1 Tax=Vicia villosa TaxID=3911 RepID=UPI00273CBDCB|nr:BTB/POZ domain-containing protein At5g47800-like [Vicia villosa]
MKFMKLGTKSDTFFTEQSNRRTLTSDIPSDIVIQINDVTYLLHKDALLPKCGLLRRLCDESNDSESVNMELHDIPGGKEAFEFCAKFCYGISIEISAHSFVPAFCAAKFLIMNESVAKGNFEGKLEVFFNSFILESWRDPIATLQSTVTLPEWSENLGIVKKCIDSIIEKILIPSYEVNWSFTYSRPGYTKKQYHPVPKDWWTEDVSDLDIDLFRCLIMIIQSTYVHPPQLIGEALHVYACRWLPDITKVNKSSDSSASQTEESKVKNRKILETIVSMIPVDKGSVLVGFLFRLLGISVHLNASLMVKTELIRRASLQFEEATLSDLVYPSKSSSDRYYYDIDLVQAVLETFLKQWKRMSPSAVDNNYLFKSIRNIGKLIDSYLQVVAMDDNMQVSKFVSLAETVPSIARVDHDYLYKAIDIYLKVHPDMSKADKKKLCGILDCQKLTPEMCHQAVKNELLPLRTVVQVLYFEQEKLSMANTSQRMDANLALELEKKMGI